MQRVEERLKLILPLTSIRIRPKIMTVMAASMGLMPIMWSMGIGANIMKRIAAPMVGGLFTSFIMELLVYPPIYLLWKKRGLNS